MIKSIPLTKGLFAIVDDADWAPLSTYRWHACPSPLKDGTICWYAERTECLPDGGRRTLRMHRVILNAQPGEEVDHRDHDGLNNRRENLRKATRTQNQINVRTKGGSGGYRGVEFRPVSADYRAAVTLNKRKHYAGTFATPEQAARAYDQLAMRLHGEFARLNFPHQRAAA